MTKEVYLPAPRNELMALVLHTSLTSLERCYGNFRLCTDLSACLVECLLSPLHACVEKVGRRRLFHRGHAVTLHGQDIRADFFTYRLALPEPCRRHRWYEKKKCAGNRNKLHRFNQLLRMKNELTNESNFKILESEGKRIQKCKYFKISERSEFGKITDGCNDKAAVSI